MKNLMLKNKLTWSLVAFSFITLLASFTYTYEIGPNKGWYASFGNQSEQTLTNQLNMTFNYDQAWLEISALEKEGMLKSALEKVMVLLEHARSDGEHAHFIKALIFKGKFDSELQEDGYSKAILQLTAEMEKAGFPVKPVLQSMLAEMYDNYLRQNRWMIQNRTQTIAFDNSDIKTWTIEQLLDASSRYFWASLEPEALKTTPIDSFRLLLVEGENDDNLRPTLYDFLAHRAIDFFSNERTYLSQPAYKFDIEDPLAFAPVADFVKWNINTRDTTSQKYQTLLLFQELLQFHNKGARLPSSALLDANLKRLNFVYNNFLGSDKEKLYETALLQLKTQYEASTSVADVNAALAQLYFTNGSQYKVPAFGTEDQDDRKWLLKKAHDLCRQTVEDFPNTVGATTCHRLLNQILQRDFSLSTEMVNLPNQPFLAKMTYRNLSEVHLKAVRLTRKQMEEFQNLQNERNWQKLAVAFLNRCETKNKWSVKLPDEGDFHQHTIELKIDALPLGNYVIMLSENSNFSEEEGAVGYLETKVSRIGYWERRGRNGEISFVVFDRQTGAPIKGATVEFWAELYNSVQRKYEQKKKATKTTDVNGLVQPDYPKSRDRNFKISIQYGEDELFTDNSFYNNFYKSENRPYQQTVFFLDRGIYRPGQTIYFKGIAMNFDSQRMPAVLSNEKVTVTLRDANYQEATKLELRSNEFGTFSGQFVAPRGGLLGNMQLVSSIGGNGHSFRVEEYKRPKFEVTFEPVDQSYRIGDTVKVTGKAMAYAGNQIDGAAVSWRVVRESRFPWYGGFFRWFPRDGETMEIAHGVASTDENGRFQIDFTAIPDRTIPAANKPEFVYKVYADVTDITGETQSGEFSVRVGYISMQLDIPIGQQVNVKDFQQLKLVTKNLNGEFEPATGTIQIDLLKAPDQLYLDRYWEPTDQRQLTEAAFKKQFPHFAWKNEDQPDHWPVANNMLQENFDTEKSDEIVLPKRKWQPGMYLITINTQDRFGEKLEYKTYVNLFDLQSNTISSPGMVWHFSEDKNYEPGSTVRSFFGTSRQQQPVFVEYEKDGEVLESKWLTVKGLTSDQFSITETHRGNIYCTYSYAGMNRAASATQTILVPWSDKELTIEYGTFRDKLKPGQEEEWVIKIKGPKGDKVTAEMVAGMYDASLDAFAPNSWGLNAYPNSWSQVRYTATTHTLSSHTMFGYFQVPNVDLPPKSRSYDRLNWFDWYLQSNFLYMTKANMRAMSAEPSPMMEMQEINVAAYADGENMGAVAKLESEGVANDTSADQAVGSSDVSDTQPPMPVRSNLKETVFFFPHLMTDEEGNILIKFKMNEALTRWNFLGLAHTKDLQLAATSKQVVTQKELMVVPNPPRFFRENDEIEFTAKVVNLTDKSLSGNAQLQLVNPLNSIPVFKWTDNPQFNQNFTVEANQSARLAWRFKVPDIADVPVMEHTVIAAAGEFSDGEMSASPVLSNRMLVTETKPLPIRGHQTRAFTFESLKKNNSATLRHESVTLEFTQNPAWYAVQALPYLMEYPHECTEQIFSRYYANSLATSVAGSHPKIRAVFDKWRDFQPDALQSNLTKNEELKTALLDETPWVLQAQSEEQQKQNIALLFDLNRMAYEQEASLKKLQDRQLPGGGWAWFPGGRDSWYITQYIAEGFGHLQKLKVDDLQENPAAWQMVQQAIGYCDARMVEQYERLEEQVNAGKAKWEDDHLNYLAAHYLYVRSFFLENSTAQAGIENMDGNKRTYIGLTGKAGQVHAYYLDQAEKYWLQKGIYTEGLLALAMFRNGKIEPARKVIRSLDERSLNNDELGKYWKYPTGWWWHQAPIETQALMIEAFSDIADDAKAVDDLKIWLLKNKQTNHWKTTKATANAVYALLSAGDNWLLDSEPLQIQMGKSQAASWNKLITAAQKNAEAGTGYFKVRFNGEDVNQEMADISITNPNNVVAWGAMYWQYFEQLDKITTFEETPLTLKKQLFRVENTDRGEVIRPVNEGDVLKVGEKLKVRIELRVDRDMEYVHMKDMRASGFEPVNVLSTYKWQDGLGYYESTRDAATDFFFSYLNKGTYVFEYPLRVQHNGEFSNGVTTIQCMYAPEFTSHSEGIRVTVQE